MSEANQSADSVLFSDDALPGTTVNWLSNIVLPAELNTGHKAIDFEHRQLYGSMSTLRRLCHDFEVRKDCSACGQSTREECESELVGVLGDLLAFIIDHFRTEEMVMRESLLMMHDRDVCEAHIEDHANISAKVQEIILALEPIQTVGLVRELHALLQGWIANHAALHDLHLERWLSARGVELKFA